MKIRRNNIVFLFLLIAHWSEAALYDSPAFKVSPKPDQLCIYPNIETHNDTSLLIDFVDNISTLAISGKCILEDEESLVRVVLVDDNGKEYLVFEDFYLFIHEKDHAFSFSAMETAVLGDVMPNRINIFIRNAQINILQIICETSDEKSSAQVIEKERKRIHGAQVEYIIEKWNNYNAQVGQYWRAGKTSISGLSFSEKKNLFGATSNHYLSDGLEYYAGGFFMVKVHDDKYLTKKAPQHTVVDIQNANTEYTDSFDWRNRHGKNWMTPVKNQVNPYNNISGNGGCWIFGSIAAMESHINLYYNQLLNFDLSEQEIGSCSSSGSLHSGGFPSYAYNYIAAHGIVNEECFPFQNDSAIPCNQKCQTPQYIASISNYFVGNNGASQLKYELINHGPIASGVSNGKHGINHVMCLCGYGVIHEGDHVKYLPQTPHSWNDSIIPANCPLIGQTYWIYKNSYGLNNGLNGYVYVVFENDKNRAYTTLLSYPVTVSTLTNDSIICEDADRDGFYFWGLGPKPAHCPVCCPDIPDGDDSDPTKGEMDSYGNFSTYSFPYPTITINCDTSWNSDQTQCGNVIVKNNATLTITARLTMNPAAKITIRQGGTLIVDGGAVVNANIDVKTSSKIKLLNSGILYLKQFGNLNVNLGAEADIDYGQIICQ